MGLLPDRTPSSEKQGNQSPSQPLGIVVEPQPAGTWTDAALSPVSKWCFGGGVGDREQVARDSVVQTIAPALKSEQRFESRLHGGLAAV